MQNLKKQVGDQSREGRAESVWNNALRLVADKNNVLNALGPEVLVEVGLVEAVKQRSLSATLGPREGRKTQRPAHLEPWVLAM